MTLDLILHSPDTAIFMGLGLEFILIALSGRTKEETQSFKLSVPGYAVISCSDGEHRGSLSGLKLIIPSAVLESKTQAVSFLN